MAVYDRDMLPPLPKFTDNLDLLMAVYTHDSLLPRGVSRYAFGDIDHLEEIGSKALNMAITYHYFCAAPSIDAVAITIQRDNAITDEDIDAWLDAYGLKDKLLIAPKYAAEVLNSKKEMRRYFCTYIGALYIRDELQQIQTWISALIDPTAVVSIPETKTPQPLDNLQSSESSQGYVRSYKTHEPHVSLGSPKSHAKAKRRRRSKKLRLRVDNPWMAKGGGGSQAG